MEPTAFPYQAAFTIAFAGLEFGLGGVITLSTSFIPRFCVKIYNYVDFSISKYYCMSYELTLEML